MKAADPQRPGGPVMRQALLRFVASSFASLCVLGAGAVFLSEHIAHEEALRDARSRGAAVAHSVAAPLVDSEVRAGSPKALARLGEVLENRMRDGSVTHIKLWTDTGHVLWSNRPEIVGKQFQMGEEIESLFGTTREVSSLIAADHPEHAGEKGDGAVVEVYVGTEDADGVPLVVETYMSAQSMETDADAILGKLLPFGLGVLLIFQLSILPLAVSLAKRIRSGQAELAEMSRRAQLSSEVERRRIAQDLHDGVVQDLAGLSYAFPAVVASVVPGPEGDPARETAERISAVLQRDVAALRTLLTDIFPPNLEGEGLSDALTVLADKAGESGVRVTVEVEDGFKVPVEHARLVYRLVREGLRNVVTHARARHASVHLGRLDGDVVVRVADDGRGLGNLSVRRPGHLGVALLSAAVTDLGGCLELRPGVSGGTVLEAWFPGAAGEEVRRSRLMAATRRH